jgi:hypothetical protein
LCLIDTLTIYTKSVPNRALSHLNLKNSACGARSQPPANHPPDPRGGRTQTQTRTQTQKRTLFPTYPVSKMAPLPTWLRSLLDKGDNNHPRKHAQTLPQLPSPPPLLYSSRLCQLWHPTDTQHSIASLLRDWHHRTSSSSC